MHGAYTHTLACMMQIRTQMYTHAHGAFMFWKGIQKVKKNRPASIHTHASNDTPNLFVRLPCPLSAEIDQKLQEIMKQTGYLKIDGQVRDYIIA